MASVQELLALAEAQKSQSPATSVVQKTLEGFQQAQQGSLDRTIKLMDLDQKRREMEYQAKMAAQFQNQFDTHQENSIQQGHSSVGAPPAVFPEQKLARKWDVDGKGHISASYSFTEPNKKGLQMATYVDKAGKSRIGSFNPETGAITQTENDPLAPANLTQEARADAAKTRTETDQEKQWHELAKHVNTLQQSSRTALGASAIANQRADRALHVLGNPEATDQDLKLAVADMAGIFQGGAPFESSLREQGYSTLITKFNNLATLVSATPQPAKQPAIQAKLREVVNDIKNVDNKIIRDNLGIEAVGYRKLIKSDPGRWQDLTGAVMSTAANPDGTGGAPAPAPVSPPSVGKNGIMTVGRFNVRVVKP